MSAEIVTSTIVYDGWTKLIVASIRQAGHAAEFTREIEFHGNGVAVLPYDPVRRVAMLVRLLRAPVLYSGFGGDLLEAPAGLMDEDDPEQTARREALEEVGLKLGALEPLGTVWSSPGLSAERVSLFLAAYRSEDRVSPGGGLAAENENIIVVEMPLAELWSLLETGGLTDLKSVALLLFLRQRQPALFEPLQPD